MKSENIIFIVPNIIFLLVVVSVIVTSMPTFAASEQVNLIINQTPLVVALNKYKPKSTRKSQSSSDEVTDGNAFKVKRTKSEASEKAASILKVMLKQIDLTLDREEMLNQFDTATAGQKAIFAIYLLQNEVSNSGFSSYFTTNAGNLIPQAKQGLKLVGARRYLNLLNKALYVFADDEEMLDYAVDRRVVISNLSSDEKFSTFEPLDAEFESLEQESLLQDSMNQYIEKNPDQFFVNP